MRKNPQQKFNQSNLFDLRMPDTDDADKAIPTGYGKRNNGITFDNSIASEPEGITEIRTYFKRKPKDLLGAITTARYFELEKIFSTGEWPDSSVCPEVYTDEFNNFKNSVQEFTNAIFSDEKFVESVRENSADRDKIVACVGHPTKWDKLDALIYKTILKDSILGKTTYHDKLFSFILAAESRAAYLFLRDKGTVKDNPQGTCSLLIDVGSSTIDVTAAIQNSRNYSYNDGNNYLGVRIIDFMIRDWYFEQLKNHEKRSC